MCVFLVCGGGGCVCGGGGCVCGVCVRMVCVCVRVSVHTKGTFLLTEYVSLLFLCFFSNSDYSQ